MLATASCSHVDEGMDWAGGVTVNCFEASIDDPDTRTYAVAGADGSVQMLWAPDDQVFVTDGNASSIFKLKSGEGTKRATFTGSITSNSNSAWAVYPASVAEMDGGQIKVTLPSVQTYSPRSDINVNDRNVMLGVSSDFSTISFRTVASIARFDVTVGADEYISSVTMRVEDGYLTGKGVANLEERSLGQLSCREVMLTYSEPSTGTSVGGWALIAPLDFKTLDGKVYYDVVTSKGKYTFCRKPTRTFLPGNLYIFPLSVDKFEKVDKAEDLTDGKYLFESTASNLTVRTVRATDTTIAVGWSAYGSLDGTAEDKADLYELFLYDANDNLLVAWRPNKAQASESKEIYSHSAYYKTRFVFSGLTPDTVYKVKVVNVTDNETSNILTTATAPTFGGEIVTTAQKQGDVLVFQNFGKLVWNGDLTTFAAGYEYADGANLTNIENGIAWGDFRDETDGKYQYSVCTRERNLFTTYKNASFTQSLGLGDWGYWRNSADDATSSSSSAVLLRPSYVKMGVTKVRAGMATPELSALLGKATVKVSFKACIYGSSSVDDYTDVVVMALDDCTVNNWRVSSSNVVAKQTFNISDKLEWQEYSAVLSGVTPTSRIVIAGNAESVASKNNRFHLDDVKVEFLKYDDDSINYNAPIVEQVASSTTSVTVEWTKTSGYAYTVTLYSDKECANKIAGYSLNVGHNSYFGTWPARFTLPALAANRTYYVTVKDGSGNLSKPVQVRTSDYADSVDKQVLGASFDNLCTGGDYINMAYSVKITSNTSVGSLSEALGSATVALPDADGAALSSYTTNMISLFGMDGWTSTNAYPRQGYIKLGISSAAGVLTTPALQNLTSDNVQLTVSFKAAPFVTSASVPQTDYIYVRLIDGNSGAEKASNKVTIGGMTNMPGWGDFSTTFSGANAVDKIQFVSGADANSCFCLEDVVITSPAALDKYDVCGYVTDSDGLPLSGVVVSDGFSAVKTSSNGYYTMSVHDDCWYIYVSIPSYCQVPINDYGQPAFFKKYDESVKRYDFSLAKLAGGAESKFSLICLADPQCKNQTQRNRFNNECVPDLKAHVKTKDNPCYGVTLGDVAYSEGIRNCESQMPYLRNHMSKDNIGIPIFQTMGNHDYTYFYSNNELKADETSSTQQIKAQRAFEDVFGPINYSWNRGDVHIVCMRNMLWSSFTSASNYSCGFSDEQYEWLKQDLSFVPKTSMVILCVHIPLVGATSGKNVQNAVSLLKQFKEAHIMSGHTHYMRNEPAAFGGSVYEHVHAAVCGTWWYSNVNGDGCPNGYGVYDIEGTTIKNSYYKGVNTGMDDRDYQIRLYRGNLRCGGQYDYIQLQHGSGVILANVFNADSSWRVKVYENGVYSGDMTMIPNKKESPSIGTSESSPCKPSTASSQDWWAIGYHTGVVGRGHSSVGGNRSSYMTNSFYHMYKYTLKNSSATIKVEATDRWGRVYSTSTFTGDYDYSVMEGR